jgi:GntR family transcriptional repressor for pyruvate dehydrogenase complex
MSFVVDIHQDDSVLELFEVRRILEPAAAALATPRMTAEDITYLRALLAEVDDTTTADELVANDMVFHRRIAERSGNAYLTSLLDTLSGSTLRARVWRGLTEEGAVARTLTEHRAIVDALEQGDAALASAQLTVHISGVMAWLRRALA